MNNMVVKVKRFIVWIVIFAIYVSVGLPIINGFLMPSIINFINNYGDMLVYNYTMTNYVYNKTSQQFDTQYIVRTIDLRGLVVFIVQICVYILIPLVLIIKVFKK